MANTATVDELGHSPEVRGKNYLNQTAGVWSWLTTVDHKRIGIMYLVSVLVGFGLGGIFALLVRLELLTAKKTIMDATQYKRTELLRTAMWRDMARLFESYDALLCPTCAIVAPPVELTDDDFAESLPDGRLKGLDMTCPFNLLPQCPALSLPVDRAGVMPVGLQIVGRRYADEDVLAIALGMEKVLAASR